MVLAAFYHTILAIFFAVIASLLIIVILLQRGKGVGLAGAFGGAGGGTAFGAKTGDVLTWVTVIGAVVLLSYTVVLNFVFQPSTPDLQNTSQLVAPPLTPSTAPPTTTPPSTAPPTIPPVTPPAETPPADDAGGNTLHIDMEAFPPLCGDTAIFASDLA